MTDVFSKAKRSYVMSRIRGRDTGPEKIVRSALHRMGYRFRLHSSDLPGKPDIVLARYRTVIFVHGCFWHRHKGCRYSYMPKTRKQFWVKKFERNVTRDREVRAALKKLGWNTVVLWECELRFPKRFQKKLDSTLKAREMNLRKE